MPTHVLLKAQETGLLRDSVVLCENPEKMSKDRVGELLTVLPDVDMRRIAMAHLLATSAISFIDKESLINVWERATALNYKPA